MGMVAPSAPIRASGAVRGAVAFSDQVEPIMILPTILSFPWEDRVTLVATAVSVYLVVITIVGGLVDGAVADRAVGRIQPTMAAAAVVVVTAVVAVE